MKHIITKRHPIKFYTYVILWMSFLVCLGTAIMISSFDLLNNKPEDAGKYMAPLFALFFYLFAIFILYSYLINAPIIALDEKSIKIGSVNYSLKDIKKINFSGKRYLKFIGGAPKEGMEIIFKDGTKKTLIDEMYTNLSELKVLLEELVYDKKNIDANLIDPINVDVPTIEYEVTFKGNPWLSKRGVYFWGSIGLLVIIIYISFDHLSIRSVIFMFFVVVIWCFIQCRNMYFFALKADYLIVRNHIFFWKSKIIRLTEIREIVFESGDNQPNIMRIITKDFKHKLYRAGTLSDKMWLNMKSKLVFRDVLVRNECITEKRKKVS